MNIGIVGATGNVGRKIIEIIHKKKISINNLYFVASSKSAGSVLEFGDKEIKIENLENFDFSKVDLSFFCAGKTISEKYVPLAAKHSVVIDNSSFFRMDPDVPLIVPQVNKDHLKNVKKNIIANPNCSTAQLVIVLKSLNDSFKIKRVVISTYQSTSGAGKKPMDELIDQTKSILNNKNFESKNFTKQIAFNAIPHIDSFSDDGYTKEELKMIHETNKILGTKIDITATCVRIPVLVSHAESVNIEFENDFTIKKVKELLNSAEGCKVVDENSDGGYITPVEAEGKNETFISRIRKDNSKKNALNMWIVSDNLLRGAALNAVEIRRLILKDNIIMKENNPLSPHIQIYNWHVSSLVSISHRITGIVNYFLLIFICIWASSLFFGEGAYEIFKLFLNSVIGKFFIISLIWSYTFQILSEVRHWFWDIGLGFELKTTKITGLLVIFGSFLLTILIYSSRGFLQL